MMSPCSIELTVFKYPQEEAQFYSPTGQYENVSVRTLNQIRQMIDTARSVHELIAMVKNAETFVNGRSLFLPLLSKENAYFFISELAEKDNETVESISRVLKRFLKMIERADSLDEARKFFDRDDWKQRFEEMFKNNEDEKERCCTIV